MSEMGHCSQLTKMLYCSCSLGHQICPADCVLVMRQTQQACVPQIQFLHVHTSQSRNQQAGVLRMELPPQTQVTSIRSCVPHTQCVLLPPFGPLAFEMNTMLLLRPNVNHVYTLTGPVGMVLCRSG